MHKKRKESPSRLPLPILFLLGALPMILFSYLLLAILNEKKVPIPDSTSYPQESIDYPAQQIFMPPHQKELMEEPTKKNFDQKNVPDNVNEYLKNMNQTLSQMTRDTQDQWQRLILEKKFKKI